MHYKVSMLPMYNFLKYNQLHCVQGCSCHNLIPILVSVIHRKIQCNSGAVICSYQYPCHQLHAQPSPGRFNFILIHIFMHQCQRIRIPDTLQPLMKIATKELFSKFCCTQEMPNFVKIFCVHFRYGIHPLQVSPHCYTRSGIFIR